mmetsp:Transcript_11156/g.39504  ORF Transcript_11156/g.39504 Transcript_11156/m.39504 type:complete len:312 (-) Transcript_11156:1083-2018(-)
MRPRRHGLAGLLLPRKARGYGRTDAVRELCGDIRVLARRRVLRGRLHLAHCCLRLLSAQPVQHVLLAQSLEGLGLAQRHEGIGGLRGVERRVHILVVEVVVVGKFVDGRHGDAIREHDLVRVGLHCSFRVLKSSQGSLLALLDDLRGHALGASGRPLHVRGRGGRRGGTGGLLHRQGEVGDQLPRVLKACNNLRIPRAFAIIGLQSCQHGGTAELDDLCSSNLLDARPSHTKWCEDRRRRTRTGLGGLQGSEDDLTATLNHLVRGLDVAPRREVDGRRHVRRAVVEAQGLLLLCSLPGSPCLCEEADHRWH